MEGTDEMGIKRCEAERAMAMEIIKLLECMGCTVEQGHQILRIASARLDRYSTVQTTASPAYEFRSSS